MWSSSLEVLQMVLQNTKSCRANEWFEWPDLASTNSRPIARMNDCFEQSRWASVHGPQRSPAFLAGSALAVLYLAGSWNEVHAENGWIGHRKEAWMISRCNNHIIIGIFIALLEMVLSPKGPPHSSFRTNGMGLLWSILFANEDVVSSCLKLLSPKK